MLLRTFSLDRSTIPLVVAMLLLLAVGGQGVRSEAVPHETQSAQCTITAGDVQASAQATISKRLEGVCGSVQLARSFELLELRLMQELAEIRRFLLASNSNPNVQPLLQHGPPNVGNYMQLVPQDSPSPQSPSADPPTTPVSSSTPSVNSTQLPVTPTTPETPTATTSIAPNLTERTTPPPLSTTLTPATPTSSPGSRIIHFQPVQLKSLHPVAPNSTAKKRRTRPRELEVARFNNTLLRGDEIRIFSYYWRIEDFRGKLLARNVSEIESPIFSISGLHLRVRAVLNHLNRDYLYLQLQSVPHRRSSPIVLPADADRGEVDDDDDDESDVVLQSGSMFREIETREYFRHKIVILDQETPTKDLVSQEFFNTRSGFPVPNSAIVAGPYAKDSTILVKVVIYL